MLFVWFDCQRLLFLSFMNIDCGGAVCGSVVSGAFIVSIFLARVLYRAKVWT